ncbi:hypothetical protein ACH5RR_006610 [Cinchona calisaya]|uniref:Uncharacterized protein n=1 Tax=Cinchona calisaya TaxID=153742 RepID=A0ABD3APW3_9GENT
MSSMGDNTKSADVSISVESVDDQSSLIPPPKIATTASEPPLSKKSRVLTSQGAMTSALWRSSLLHEDNPFISAILSKKLAQTLNPTWH